ncbi:MAG: MmcQ/YjbR family DNA-binding protein [Bacteroidales bacterium]|jgi:predicted DNA-binding protein (MmcQ/YjbR family)|nr:MmcQ/YjbR family DNA-binding protein [Bacteroidales bacterium]
MNIEELRTYCLSKPAVTESFPFDEVTLVFKVKNKMFALLSIDDAHGISLKCDPERAIELREKYPAIIPGYHLNKRLWNTIKIDSSISNKLIIELIDHSYDLIVDSLPKKIIEELKNETNG